MDLSGDRLKDRGGDDGHGGHDERDHVGETPLPGDRKIGDVGGTDLVVAGEHGGLYVDVVDHVPIKEDGEGDEGEGDAEHDPILFLLDVTVVDAEIGENNH